MADYTSAYDNRSGTVITSITTDPDVQLSFSSSSVRSDEIDFAPYDNPDIDVTTSARFAEHEIIGGTTVRQKLGEDPREISMSGVCTERVATEIDQLDKAKLVTLLTDRIPGGARCQVASTRTEVLEPGGVADMDKGEFLYYYSINLVEVETQASSTTTTTLVSGGNAGQ